MKKGAKKNKKRAKRMKFEFSFALYYFCYFLNILTLLAKKVPTLTMQE